MAAYKVGAEGGNVTSQYMVGEMYYEGYGVDVDYKQARAWLEKAAAQDHPFAAHQLGTMYFTGDGVTPSWRRAREYFERAIELGNSMAVENMQTLTENIQKVTSQRSNHFTPSPLVRDLMLIPPQSLLLSHSQHAPLMDKRVEIHGTSRADMNGKRGVTTDFHPMDEDDNATWRYAVKLDGGEAFKVKPAHVRAEGAGSANKAKGKGKKGRTTRK